MNGRYLILVCLVFCQIQAYTQILSPEIVATGGDFFSNSTAMLSSTIGESVVIETFSDGNHILTQGFQQTENNNSGISENATLANFTCWPNPTAGPVQLSFSAPANGQLCIHVYDALGQHTGIALVKELMAGEYLETLVLNTLSQGYYILHVQYHQNNGNIIQTSRKISIVQSH